MGVAAVLPPERSGALALVRVQPASDDAGGLIERLRRQLPTGARVGGAAAEAHDLEQALAGRTPLVYALVLTVGFILLLTVVRAPLAAGAAVLLNLLATAAAFGVATLIFQDGVGESLLGFKSQGFVDAWAPVFFFCLSFALAMDYTVFLLTSVRDEFERTGDAREALVEGLARSGRVINAAGAVMVVVFFTFGLSRPLPPKEMGVILGVAVLAGHDAGAAAPAARGAAVARRTRLVGPFAHRPMAARDSPSPRRAGDAVSAASATPSRSSASRARRSPSSCPFAA